MFLDSHFSELLLTALSDLFYSSYMDIWACEQERTSLTSMRESVLDMLTYCEW